MWSKQRAQLTDYWDKEQLSIEDVAAILGRTVGTVRKRVDRQRLKAPVRNHPARWDAADIWSEVDPPDAIPLKYRRVTTGAQFVGVEPVQDGADGVSFVYQHPELGVVRLVYKDDRGGIGHRLAKRFPDEFICVVAPHVGVRGHDVLVHHPGIETVERAATGPLSRVLGQDLPFVPSMCRRSDALAGWEPGARPITVYPRDLLYKDEDLRTYSSGIARHPQVQGVIHRLWEASHQSTVDASLMSMRPLEDPEFGAGLVLAARPELPEHEVGERPDNGEIYEAVTTPVGFSSSTLRIAQVLPGVSGPSSRSFEIDGASDGLQALLERLEVVPEDQVTLGHLMLAEDTWIGEVTNLRHEAYPLVAARDKAKIALLAPSHVLAAGLKQLDITDPMNPVYQAEDGEWLPLPQDGGDTPNAGYSGGGTVTMACTILWMLTDPPAGTLLRSDYSRTPQRDRLIKAMSLPGALRMWSRGELEAV